ncbi:restriction endonuclease subunit S [Flavobacterium sp. XS2P12]|uniref:restriction endonuclease subunit S n=1 Tax=Flavobacterium melibiosi TaxID=3398734 RepID=UPI003A848099
MISLKELISKPISGEWGSDGEGIKVLRTTNFTNKGILNFDKVVTRNVSDKIIEQKKLQKGDIIIEKSGGSPTQPVGRVVYFEEEGDFICNNFTSILRPKREKVFPKYLHHILFANHKFGITEMFQNKTTGIINLQLTRYLEKSKIPLPSLETQKHITKILDDATDLRNKTEQLLKEYDLLAKSIFSDMFGDPVTNKFNFPKGSIRDLVNDVKYGTSEKASDEGQYPYLRMNNLTYEGYMDYSSMKYVDISDNHLHKYLVEKGDLLFNRTNSKELVGKTAVFDSLEPMVAAGYLIRVRFNKNANPFFVRAYLNSKYGKLVLRNMCKSIVGMANINAQELQNIMILHPPIKLQNQFAEKIDLIEKQKELAKQELKESEDLFNCLLQKAFKGELA